MSHVIISPT